MKKAIKHWAKPLLFILGGALVGYIYSILIGCPSGSCPILSNPVSSMLYMAFIGWLLSNVFGSGCNGKCNM